MREEFVRRAREPARPEGFADVFLGRDAAGLVVLGERGVVEEARQLGGGQVGVAHQLPHGALVIEKGNHIAEVEEDRADQLGAPGLIP